MCDTKYFATALDEYKERNWSHTKTATLANVRLQDLSTILRRAQELKDADAAARNKEQRGTIYHGLTKDCPTPQSNGSCPGHRA